MHTLVHFVDSNHQVEQVVLDSGRTYYLAQFKKWNGIGYYYANYRSGRLPRSFSNFRAAYNHIAHSLHSAGL